MLHRSILLGLALAVSGFSSASAQDACAAAAAVSSVDASIQAISANAASADEANQALGALAADLIAKAQAGTCSALEAEQLASALESIANASTDPTQQASIKSFADTVRSGQLASIDLGTGIAASGN